MLRRVFQGFRWRVALVVVVASLPVLVHAHHGWAWASGEKFELTGRIVAVRLGNPHGEVDLQSNGERWTVEVGQPWRNERAGLTAELLSAGRVITVHGNRSKREDERLVKAVRVIIDGKDHVLYPDR